MKIKKSKKVNSITRRQFISHSAIAGTTLFLSPHLMANSTPNSNKNLVLIFLRGGCDGLSAVAPYTNAVSSKLKNKRPNIAYNVSNNASDSFFGINRELTELISLYNTGDLAIIHGTGGKNETTSHFAQMDYIESGSSKKILNEGFLARFAKRLNSETYALEAILPRSLRSADKFALQFTNKNQLATIQRRPQQTMRLERGTFLTSLFSGGAFKIIREKANTLNEQQNQVNRKLASNSATTSTGYKSTDIALLSEMISKGNNGVYSLSNGGWDHHRRLKDVFVKKTNDLFADLRKLKTDLQKNGKWQNTTIVVMSEFGRRIGENGSLGCDHGRGGVAYVLGGQVKGKKIYRNTKYDTLLSTAISKTETAPKECLPVSTDVRLVFAEIFNKVYGIKNKGALNQIFSFDGTAVDDPIPNVDKDYLGFIA